MNYYQKLRYLREANEKSQQEVADYLHIAQTQYSRYETGKREITASLLADLCNYYDVSADYILGLPQRSLRRY